AVRGELLDGRERRRSVSVARRKPPLRLVEVRHHPAQTAHAASPCLAADGATRSRVWRRLASIATAVPLPMPDERSPSDAELLTAFRAGSSRAFETLVRRYQAPVLAIARRFARDQDDAEDLAQRAFINACERAGGWRGGSFKSWLFRIVVNLAKNHLRDISRFDRSAETDEHEGETPAPSAEERMVR